MKKLLVLIFFIVFITIITTEEYVLVPKESFRFRIISNSNTKEDMYIKQKVLENVLTLIKSEIDIENTKSNVENNLTNIDKIINKTLVKYNYNKSYEINYGTNYFPKKILNGVVYPEGEYDSLVITLGEGKGNNFWCVLFPPLCMMEASEDTNDVEYKFKIKEIIESFFE